MSAKKRISISLNPRKFQDAQILAALDLVGGEMADVLKSLAYRGVISDPSLIEVFSRGAEIVGAACKSAETSNSKTFMQPKAKAPVVQSQFSAPAPVRTGTVQTVSPTIQTVNEIQAHAEIAIASTGTAKSIEFGNMDERALAARVIGDFE